MSLRSVRRKWPCSAVSIAVRQTSPSPCTPWPSPQENSAPGTNTGKYSLAPAPSSLLSRLPPIARGISEVMRPQAGGGATPITPKNGLSGRSSPQGSRPTIPFFGVMGVAPPPAWGRITSLIPRAMGGNLDNKELIPGAKLYLPVFVPGALFSCGDGHGVQGDGEVCVTAI